MRDSTNEHKRRRKKKLTSLDTVVYLCICVEVVQLLPQPNGKEKSESTRLREESTATHTKSNALNDVAHRRHT